MLNLFMLALHILSISITEAMYKELDIYTFQ